MKLLGVSGDETLYQGGTKGWVWCWRGYWDAVGMGGAGARVAQGAGLGQVIAQSQGSAAQKLIEEGMALFDQGSKEALEQALVKFAEAIRVIQAADAQARMDYNQF